MKQLRSSLVACGMFAACLANAQAWGFGGAGGSLVDDNGTVNGVATFNKVVSGTNTVITSVTQIVLAQIVHTWVGDVRATVTHVGSGTSVHLFHYVLGDGSAGFGDNTNLGTAGNYWFIPSATQSIEQAAATRTDTQNVIDGNYRPAGQASFGSGVNGANSVNADYSVFNGLLLDGTWRLTIEDKANGDTGTLDHWEMHGTGQPVPEPATMVALGLGALALMRRKRRTTR